jgi:hypothetical protein
MTNDELQKYLDSQGGIRSTKTVAVPGGDRHASTATEYTTNVGTTITVVDTSDKTTDEGIPDYQVIAQDNQTDTQRKPQGSTAPKIVEQHTDEDGTEWTQWSDGTWTKKGPSGAEQRLTRAEARAAERELESEKEKAETAKRQAEQQAEQNRLAQARLDLDRETRAADDARAAATANRPTIVSAPSTARRIAQMDGAGNITSITRSSMRPPTSDRPPRSRLRPSGTASPSRLRPAN